jgi:multidrug resistance efflux pump
VDFEKKRSKCGIKNLDRRQVMPDKILAKENSSPGLVLPKFRDDLEINSRVSGERISIYTIRDPRSEKVFEINEKDLFLCQQLNGQTHLSVITQRFEDRFSESLEMKQLNALIHKLHSEGLLFVATRLADFDVTRWEHFPKLRMENPDRLFKLLASIFRWCFSRTFVLGSFLVIFLAVGIAIKYAATLFEEMQIFWKPGPFFAEWVFGFFILNFLAEMGKGVACKYYGGHVSEFGVIWIYKIVPHFFCDVDNALWGLRKPERLKIIAAGLFCQLLLWAVCMIGWKNTASGSLVHTFWVIFIIAASLFFLFNLIPLSFRDGYYLLIAWLEIPDFWSRSRAVARSRILWRPLPEPLSYWALFGFKFFGVLSIIYIFGIWILVVGVFAYLLIWHWNLGGLGACLILGLLAVGLEDPFRRHFMRISFFRKFLSYRSGAAKVRIILRLLLLASIVIVALVPYPFEAGGEFRLMPARQLGIRSQVSAEVQKVLVEEGQWVKEDDVIATLRGRDQERKVESVKAALDEAQANLKLLKEGPKPEAVAMAEQEVKTAAKSLLYSNMMAERFAKLVKDSAASVQSYENALKQRDLDIEKLELAKRNLELVESGARDEEIEALEAEVRRLKVELRHAEEDLKLTVLTCPIDGRIITPHLKQKVGQLLKEGDLFAVVENAKTIIAEIEVPEEDVAEINIGSSVRLRTWVYPSTSFKGKIVAVAPVAYEKSRGRIERTYTEQELILEQNETLKGEGKVVRVLSELPNEDGLLKTDMTGYAKIDCGVKPVCIAFTRWLVRFIMVEVWSWIP